MAAARQLNKDWAAKLINAVLRRFQREQPALLQQLEQQPSARYAFPAWLLEALQSAWPEHWPSIVEASNSRPPMSLRVNLGKGSRAQYARLLSERGITAKPIPSLDCGLILDKPMDAKDLPGFKDGLVSVQDGGAQLAAGLLDLAPGQRVLDACAAPGGKTCHILETEPGLAGLTAVDQSPARLERVQENLSRLGLRAEILCGDASRPEGKWAQGIYDRILLDVPCSASGVIRRHPDIKLLRRATDIATLSALQEQILQAVWPLLAPGGILLYATCSILPQENEQQVQRFMGGRSDVRELAIEASWGHCCNPGRQVLPGEGTMDGFYYARLQKT